MHGGRSSVVATARIGTMRHQDIYGRSAVKMCGDVQWSQAVLMVNDLVGVCPIAQQQHKHFSAERRWPSLNNPVSGNGSVEWAFVEICTGAAHPGTFFQ